MEKYKKYYKINFHGSSMITEEREVLITECEALLNEIIELESEYDNEINKMVEEIIFRDMKLSDELLVGELYNYNNLVVVESASLSDKYVESMGEFDGW